MYFVKKVLELEFLYENFFRNSDFYFSKIKELWKSSSSNGVNSLLFKVIESIYKNGYGLLRIKEETSEVFKMDKGLKRAVSLSPLLFFILMF